MSRLNARSRAGGEPGQLPSLGRRPGWDGAVGELGAAALRRLVGRCAGRAGASGGAGRAAAKRAITGELRQADLAAHEIALQRRRATARRRPEAWSHPRTYR